MAPAPKPMGRYGRPALATATPLADGGVSDPTVQSQDQSFNNNLRDTSTDLGDISGTNSRRSMEFLQQGQGLEDQSNQYGAGYASDYAGARDSANSQISQLEQNPATLRRKPRKSTSTIPRTTPRPRIS